MDGSTGDAFRAQREAALRLAAIWAELMEGTARGASQTLAASGEPVRTIAKEAAEYAAVATRPVRDVLEGQRAFAEHVGRWAAMQREIADGMAAWAEQQKEHLDALDRLLPPYSS